MCGFAGCIGAAVSSDLLQKMGNSLIHRGPDGQGIWQLPDKQVSFVARRLSIQDLSEAGAQPMMDREKEIVLVFNGEIYNHRVLRHELELCGYELRSHCDTELVLYAYKQWGIACLEKFDGMFAIALYDCRTNQLFLARDRMGIKPLYFSTQGNGISFASEIKALWYLPWMIKRVSLQAVSHYLTFLATPAPMTLFHGVYKLPAGHYAHINEQRSLSFHQWYDPLQSKTEINAKSPLTDIRSLLRDAVHKRLIADVPVGAFLSGGLDSSFIVALMKEQQHDIKTFNISFEDDPEREERSWARKVAKKFATDHHELIISEQDAFSVYETMVYHQDEPLGDSVCIPLYFVSKLARDTGVKVVLSGEGSDELFCGYPMYVNYLKLQKWWQPTQHYIPSVIKRGLFYAARPLYGSMGRQDLLYAWAHDKKLFWGGVRLFPDLIKHDLIESFECDNDPIIMQLLPYHTTSYEVMDYYRSEFSKKYSGDFLSMMTYLELKHRLPELLLTRTDKMTMAASIEGRVPFLDQKLVEYMLAVPGKWKYRNGQTKYILKKAAEGILPHEIIYREKMGFVSPVTRWFKYGTYFRTHLLDQLHSGNWNACINVAAIEKMLNKNITSNRDYSYHLWAIHNLLGFDVV